VPLPEDEELATPVVAAEDAAPVESEPLAPEYSESVPVPDCAEDADGDMTVVEVARVVLAAAELEVGKTRET